MIRRLLLPGALVVLLCGLTIALAVSPSGQQWSGDLEVYRHYSAAFIAGDLTTTSFLDWYPALSLVPLSIAQLPFGGHADLPQYALFFALVMAVVAAATAKVGSSLVARSQPDQGSRAYVISGVLLLLAASVVVFRYDIVPAFAAGAGMLAIVAGWPLAAGVALVLSAGLKIYAVVVVAVGMLWYWAGREWRPLIRFTAGVGVAALLSLLPYVFLTPSSPLGPIAFNTGRPLQIESVAGGLVSLLTLGSPLPVTFDYGSFNFVGELPRQVARILSPVQIAIVGLTLLAIAGAFVRDRRADTRTERRLVVAALTSILALTLTSRVLSPQYLLWLLPFLGVLGAESRRTLSLGVATFGLSLVIFPIGYGALITQHPMAVAVLNVRNGLLVVLWVALAWELMRSSHPSIVSQSTPVDGRRSTAAKQLRPKSTVGP